MSAIIKICYEIICVWHVERGKLLAYRSVKIDNIAFKKIGGRILPYTFSPYTSRRRGEVKEMAVSSYRRARLSQLAEAGLENADGGDGGCFGS
jgi:hypothetical protein